MRDRAHASLSYAFSSGVKGSITEQQWKLYIRYTQSVSTCQCIRAARRVQLTQVFKCQPPYLSSLSNVLNQSSKRYLTPAACGLGRLLNRFRRLLLHSCCSKIDFGSGFPDLFDSDPASPLGARALATAVRSLRSLVSD